MYIYIYVHLFIYYINLGYVIVYVVILWYDISWPDAAEVPEYIPPDSLNNNELRQGTRFFFAVSDPCAFAWCVLV